jgi:hypothetical protein
VGSTRRIATIVAVTAALAAVMVGTGAVAQQDEPGPVVAADDQTLLDRLGELEARLPEDVDVGTVDLDAETSWGTFGGDAGSVHAVLETLESELRQLFIDGDEADGEVADAVTVIARGWLDVWHGTRAIAAYESNDLAFPLDTVSDDEVATGADELRGSAETGLELVLQGRARHLEGYSVLRRLGPSEGLVQARFDERAVAAERFDAEVRPLLALLLSKATPSVAVPTERFETDAPGIEPRASSFTIACVDRDVLDEADVVVTDEVLPELQEASPDRIDCPALHAPIDGVGDDELTP